VAQPRSGSWQTLGHHFAPWNGSGGLLFARHDEDTDHQWRRADQGIILILSIETLIWSRNKNGTLIFDPIPFFQKNRMVSFK